VQSFTKTPAGVRRKAPDRLVEGYRRGILPVGLGSAFGIGIHVQIMGLHLIGPGPRVDHELTPVRP
jgi:hypothetical protein